MEICTINKHIRNVFFYFGMSLSCIYMSIYISVYSVPFSTVFAVLIFGLFLAVIILSRQSQKEKVLFAIISLLCAACSVTTHDTLVLRIVFMIFAAREINKTKMVEFITKCYWLMIIIIPFTCVFRGIETAYSDSIPGVGRELGRRFMFGFDGPNRLGVIWICLMSMLLIRRGKRNTVKDFCLIIVTISLYYLTKSRSLIITGSFILAFPYFVRMIGVFKKYIVNKNIIILFLVLFVGITVCFSIKAADRDSIFNVFLNNRLVHFQSVVKNEPVTLFGNTADFGEYKGLDNSYFLNFYRRGIVFSFLYVIAVYRLAVIVGRKKEIMQFSVLCGFIMLAFVQDVIQHPYINIIYFLIMINYHDFFGIKHKNNKHIIRGAESYDT